MSSWSLLLAGLATVCVCRVVAGTHTKTYEMVALIETPASITFPGSIGERCMQAALQGFSQPRVRKRQVCVCERVLFCVLESHISMCVHMCARVCTCVECVRVSACVKVFMNVSVVRGCACVVIFLSLCA